MGLFLALSGVIGADGQRVKEALSGYAEANGGGLEEYQGTTEQPNVGVLAEQGQRATVLYPGEFCDWDGASRHLSAALEAPVFSLHIHDGDLWMYVLFDRGEEVDWFNPVPDYWQDSLPEDERRKWQGVAAEVAARVPGVEPDVIAGYLAQ